MGLFDWLRRAAPAQTRAPVPTVPQASELKRLEQAYLAAATDRLLADFPTWARTANADIRAALTALRARQRHLAHNNDYAKNYLRTMRRNVVGPRGLQLHANVRKPDGTMDSFANTILERGFRDWCKREHCTTSGRYSFRDVQRLLVTAAARDGEFLLYEVRNAPNRYGYALQFIPIEYLDEQLNLPYGASGGAIDKAADTEIRMGVERDAGGRPVAYHLKPFLAGDDLTSSYAYLQPRYRRIPASDIIHDFRAEDADQARGVPELHTAVRRLQLLAGYEEAELTAARAAANKAGFYSREDAETDAADLADEQEGATEDNPGDFLDNAEAGTFQVLPRGYKFQPFDPQHPTAAFPDFVRQMLRGAGAGGGVAYSTFANDLTQASYGSLRVGALEDRDEWKGWQDWLGEGVLTRVYRSWLAEALARGQLEPLRVDRPERYLDVEWRGRGFAWIDPEKEANADEKAIGMRVKSRTEVCAERGRDFEDVLREQQEEQRLAKKYGIDLTPAGAPAKAPPTDDAKQEE